EHCGEAGVEDAIQRQHVDGHGKNGIKSGILVNSCHGGGELRFAVSAMDSMEGVLRWKGDHHVEARIIRPPRSETRQGKGGSRVPELRSRAGEPGNADGHVVRVAPGTRYVRHLRCLCRRSGATESSVG